MLFHLYNLNHPIYTFRILILLIHYHLHLMLYLYHLCTNCYYSYLHLHLDLLYPLSMILRSSNHYIFLNYPSLLLSNNMFIVPMLYLTSNLLSLHLSYSVLHYYIHYHYISGSRNSRMLNIILLFMLSN